MNNLETSLAYIVQWGLVQALVFVSTVLILIPCVLEMINVNV